jgi:pyrroloquinoline quinone biosynthesis protein B
LGAQLESCPDLHPRKQPLRNSPVRGVFLTNADLDHLLGLFSLREGGGFTIYATAAVRTVAHEALGLQTVLGCFCAPHWVEPSLGQFVTLNPQAASHHLLYRAIELTGRAPPFATPPGPAAQSGHSVAYQFQDQRTGGKLLVAPDVASINSELEEALGSSDAILFDGTFWSADELAQVRPGAKLAGDMGHLTVRDGSLSLLAQLPARKKIYIHINNTNPILAPDSAERAAVEAGGILVGEDGLEFEL